MKALDDLTWLKGRAQSTATASVSSACTEVTAYRQGGRLYRAQPTEFIVQMGAVNYYVYTAASRAAMFSA